jgi:hypothetical protein
MYMILHLWVGHCVHDRAYRSESKGIKLSQPDKITKKESRDYAYLVQICLEGSIRKLFLKH